MDVETDHKIELLRLCLIIRIPKVFSSKNSRM
jgi:hypothetical protein